MSGAVEGVALLPCPVCGEQPKWRGTPVDYRRGIYRLQCLGETHLFQAYGPSEAKCVANWNTRTTPPARSYADEDVALTRRAFAIVERMAKWDGACAIPGDMREVQSVAAAIRLLSQGGKA